MTLLRVGKEPFLALLVLALGLLALWETRELNEMSAVFPQTVGGILTGLGLFYLLYSLFRPVSRKGGTAVEMPHLLQAETRYWYNSDLDYSDYMVPGIAALLLTIVTSLLSAMGLVREREIGTLEQLLVTPIKKHELLIGDIYDKGSLLAFSGHFNHILLFGFFALNPLHHLRGKLSVLVPSHPFFAPAA